MRTISLRLDAQMAAWLESEARRLTRRKSDIIRDLIEEKRRNGGNPSVHGLMSDQCGSLKGQPRDVARNTRKYLRGFGE
jgi:hypothetical protein